jgi:hypothetical protein
MEEGGADQGVAHVCPEVVTAPLPVLAGVVVVAVWSLVDDDPVDVAEDPEDDADEDDDDELGVVEAAEPVDRDAGAECAVVSEEARIPSPTAAVVATIPIATVSRRTRDMARLRTKAGDGCGRV